MARLEALAARFFSCFGIILLVLGAFVAPEQSALANADQDCTNCCNAACGSDSICYMNCYSGCYNTGIGVCGDAVACHLANYECDFFGFCNCVGSVTYCYDGTKCKCKWNTAASQCQCKRNL